MKYPVSGYENGVAVSGKPNRRSVPVPNSDDSVKKILAGDCCDQSCRETALSPLDRQRQGNALTDNLDSKKEGTRSKNPRFLKNG